MRKFLVSTTLIVALLLNGSLGFAAQPEWRRVPFPPAKVLAPASLTESTDAVFELLGSYPDACYRNGPLSVQVDAELGEILIENEAFHLVDRWCVFQVVPFSRVINIGKLPAGTYRVVSPQDNSKNLVEFATIYVEKEAPELGS